MVARAADDIASCCICGGTLAVEGHQPMAFACWDCWKPLHISIKKSFYVRASQGGERARNWLVERALE